MGTCIYCGKPAGWFRDVHDECAAAHRRSLAKTNAALREVRAAAAQAFEQGGPEKIHEISAKIDMIRTVHSVSDPDTRRVLAEILDENARRFIADDELTHGEETMLATYMRAFGFGLNDPELGGSGIRIALLSIFRDLDAGVVTGIDWPDCPVNLRRREKLLWPFYNIALLGEKTRRRYVGGSRGVSIRIVKGLTYRVGSYKGEAISEKSIEHVDTGNVYVTNENIYFVGALKSLKVAIRHIVAMTPYTDGVGLDMDNEKRHVFGMEDPEMLFRLLTKVVRLDQK